MAGVHHPLHVLASDLLTIFQLSQTSAHLHDVHRIPAAGSVTTDHLTFCLSNGVPCPTGRISGNIRHLMRFQRPEVDLHAPGAQGRADLAGTAGSSAYQAKIRRHALTEYLVNMPGHGHILRAVIGRFKHHLAILQHLQQLVHLDGMKFSDLIQKQHAAMGL